MKSARILSVCLALATTWLVMLATATMRRQLPAERAARSTSSAKCSPSSSSIATRAMGPTSRRASTASTFATSPSTAASSTRRTSCPAAGVDSSLVQFVSGEGDLVMPPDGPPLWPRKWRRFAATPERIIRRESRPIAQLEYQSIGLGDLGKPEGYLERQVRGWTERYYGSRTHEFPEVERIVSWMQEHMPSTSGAALIHNDYKYDNLVLDPRDITKIIGVLDWEMCTIGDPLTDLGTALAYWIDADDPEPLQKIRWGPTTHPGSMTRAQLVERYAEKTGRDVSHMRFLSRVRAIQGCGDRPANLLPLSSGADKGRALRTECLWWSRRSCGLLCIPLKRARSSAFDSCGIERIRLRFRRWSVYR